MCENSIVKGSIVTELWQPLPVTATVIFMHVCAEEFTAGSRHPGKARAIQHEWWLFKQDTVLLLLQTAGRKSWRGIIVHWLPTSVWQLSKGPARKISAYSTVANPAPPWGATRARRQKFSCLSHSLQKTKTSYNLRFHFTLPILAQMH